MVTGGVAAIVYGEPRLTNDVDAVLELRLGDVARLDDAVGVIQRQDANLDWTYVARWINVFAEIPGREGLAGLLQQTRRRAEWLRGQ